MALFFQGCQMKVGTGLPLSTVLYFDLLYLDCVCYHSLTHLTSFGSPLLPELSTSFLLDNSEKKFVASTDRSLGKEFWDPNCWPCWLGGDTCLQEFKQEWFKPVSRTAQRD